MKYIEMTVKEAKKILNDNDHVLVAIKDLEDENDTECLFVKRRKEDYDNIFNDVKTVAAACDDFVKQLRLFTEKQNIYNIKPKGKLKTVLLKRLEWQNEFE